MTREYKMTFTTTDKTFILIHCESRDNGGKWQDLGVIRTMGNIHQMMSERVTAQERFGWTLASVNGNVLTFWKEL